MTPLLSSDPVEEFAPAKVNLCLHVTGQRADGYHLLDSLVIFAGIGDRLEARVASRPSLMLDGPFGATLPAGADNLVTRAAAALAPALPVAFRLEKHLPPASGIGGGSADAAAAIRAVRRLQGGPDPVGLTGLAAGLGADVPVCLSTRPTRMRGIGERLTPLPALPPGAILLVNPGVEVPTPAVFRALARKDNPGLPDQLPAWRNMTALAQWAQIQRNDLEAPAQDIAPVISEVLQRLQILSGALMARMSGSGATCFALFEDETKAALATTTLRGARPAWWIAAGPILT